LFGNAACCSSHNRAHISPCHSEESVILETEDKNCSPEARLTPAQAFCLQRHLPTGLQRDKEKQTPLADVLRLIHPELLLPNHPMPLPERREAANFC